MSLDAYALLGLTAIVAALVGILVYAVLRFTNAAREARLLASSDRTEGTLLTSALQDAVAELRGKQRQLQARAEASERLSAQIVQSMSSGLLLVGAAGDVQLLNPAGRRLLGVPEGAGGHYAELLSKFPALSEVIGAVLRSGEPVSRETVRVAGGPVTHLGITTSVVHDPRGKLASAICLFTDLTAVAVLEEQVRLKHSLARLGEWAASIAHEFRNGLATIHGYARLMSAEALPARDATYLQGIRAETETLGTVVSSFLEFARPAPLNVSRVDLRDFASRLVEDARGAVHDRGGEVRLEGKFPAIEADEVLLRQAFSNLLRNAVEACAESGRPPRIDIRGDVEHDGWWRLSVADNGPGIHSDMLPRIFQPFVTTKSQGTGLGLAIVQKIAVTHNGRVSAANRPEGGALFELMLPIRQRPSRDGASGSAS